MAADIHTSSVPPRSRRARSLSWATQRRLRRASKKNRKLSAADTFIFGELRAGDVAVDCGANVGDITELMSRRGAFVHAFEPDPNAFAVLSARFAGVENVVCHNAAVSNREGRMKLYFRQEHASDPLEFSIGSTLHAEKSDVDPDSFTEVQVARLARFLADLPRVRILKLDIEGAEGDVLEDLLDAGLFERIDLTLVETHETWIRDLGPRLEVIRDRLAKQGLRNVFLNWN